MLINTVIKGTQQQTTKQQNNAYATKSFYNYY
jgi:hypothetical protein